MVYDLILALLSGRSAKFVRYFGSKRSVSIPDQLVALQTNSRLQMPRILQPD